MARIKPETGKADNQPSVMVRNFEHDLGGDPTAPTAGLLARDIPGVKMPSAASEKSAEEASKSSSPATGMPRPGPEQQAAAAAAPRTGVVMPRPGTSYGNAAPTAAHSAAMPKPGAGQQAGAGAALQQPSSAAMPRPGAEQQAAATGARSGIAMPPPGAAPASATALPGTTMPKPGAGQSSGAPTSASSTASAPATSQGAGASLRHPHILQTRNDSETGQVIDRGAAAEAGPVGFAYPANLRGSTTHFNVYYDPSLGANGPTIADAVLASCEWEYSMLQGYFDGLTPPTLPFNIIVVSGLGGAFHYGCGAVDLYCDGDTSATPDVNHTRMLVVAEEVEVFSAAQGRGWACGSSNGEGLSRVLATQLYPAELNGFESASSWLNAPGRPDFVTVNDPTDRNYVSTGCSVLFLNFLRHQLRISWEEIVRAAAPTLDQTYTILTGRTDGLARFKSLVQAYYPEGAPVYLSTDNIFPLPGVMEVFARGSDGAVWHQTQTAPNNGWSGWSSLGGWVDMIEVGQNDDTRLEVFARGSDAALWHNWQLSPNGAWSGWYSMGGWIDMIELGQNADGRLEMFVRGSDGAVWHNWQVAPNSGWSGWASLGGWIDILALGKNADGRMEIFARGSDGAVWHNWQVAPNSGWSGWASLGGWVDLIEVAQNADGRLEIFARGGDGGLWHNWQIVPNGGWSGWASLGGWIDRLAIGLNDDGRMEVFARGSDGAVWHNWQTAPNNGWSGWASMGGWIDRLEVSHNADGRMEIFARGSDAALWHNWQTAPSNGWSGWNSMGGWIDMVEAFPEIPGQ